MFYKVSIVILLVAAVCWKVLPDDSSVGMRLFLLQQKVGESGTLLQEVTEAQLSMRKTGEPANLTVVVHGYFGSVNCPWVHPLAEAMSLHRGGLVVVVAYPSTISRPTMNRRIANLAQRLARLLATMVENRVTSLSQTHMVGFSMGNRILGGMGQHLGGKVARITGIDPSYPWAGVVGAGPPSPSQYLDDEDAQYVVYVKTSKISSRVGGAREIVFNGGIEQPSCEAWLRPVAEICYHHRAVWLTIEAALSPAFSHAYTTGGGRGVAANFVTHEMPPGIYHAATKESSPFLKLSEAKT